ncbi:MAG: hypothetical protein ACI9WU_005384 [Myxococcota bacterium]|jgi:hypothetical protein
MSYESRLEAALTDYAEQTGRRLDAHRFDRARPDVRGAYASFVRRRARLERSPDHLDWLALAHGLKPVFRRRVDAEGLKDMAGKARELGMEIASREVAPESSQGPRLTRWAVLRGKTRAPEWTQQPGPPLVVTVGPDRARVQAALKLREAPSLWERRPEHEAEVRELGELLGYPSCCARAYAELLPVTTQLRPVARAAERTTIVHPQLNNVVRSSPRLVSWQPCAYDCAASLALVRPLEAAVLAAEPETHRLLLPILSAPRLIYSEHRQIIFSGRFTNAQRLVYQDVFTPFAVDGLTTNAALEWVFYGDQIVPLIAGREVRITETELLVSSGESLLLRMARSADSVWLPFGAPG